MNYIPPTPALAERMIVALRPAVELPPDIYERSTHNFAIGSPTKNHRGKPRRSADLGRNSDENLKKIFRTFYLCTSIALLADNRGACRH